MNNLYSIKDIADELKVSKSTIDRIVRSKKITPIKTGKRGKKLYSDEQRQEIISSYNVDEDYKITASEPRQDHNATASEPQTDSIKTDSDHNATASDHNATASEKEDEENDFNTIDKLISLLQDEINQKNERIKQLEQDLSKAYNQISILANNASYITAADKTAQIIDKKNEDSTINQGSKKKWYQFWRK